MDLKKLYDFFDYLVQKERGGTVTYAEKDDLFDRAQWWYYNSEVDLYSKTQELKDSLSIFSVKLPLTSSSTGLVSLPTNPNANPCYQHLLSMGVKYWDNQQQKTRTKPIKFLGEDEILERLDSQILEPTTTDPVGEQLSPGEFQLYPQTTLTLTGYYLRKPLKPFFSYTMSGRTVVYNAGSSVQLEWNESSINKILIKALQLAGVNLNDELVIQYTAQKDQQDI